ncbi:MAG: hypothetical protein SGI86_15580 [Deltaproteobacteria bacterium]|nr:hypothetical protein [Deltaproteobacteria bacterium]
MALAAFHCFTLGLLRRNPLEHGLHDRTNMDTQNKDPNMKQQHTEQREGPMARSIEKQTSKIPSDWFLWSALGSIGISLGFVLAGRKEVGNFVGQWAPTFLLLGLYNKVVKVAGHDKFDSSLTH